MGNQGPHAGRAMTDPRLNSMHLDLRRREDFRKARSELLQSCGEQTQQAIEIREPADPTQASKTALQNLEGQLPADVDFFLMHQDPLYPLPPPANPSAHF